MQKLTVVKISAAGAIISFLAFTSAAAFSKPGFAFLQDYLSELGTSGFPAMAFNGGLVVTALFIAVFFIALLAEREGKRILALLASLAGIVCAIALAGVAFYPIQAEPGHTTAVYAFFSSAALAVLLSSISSLLAKTGKLSLLEALGALEITATVFLALYQEALFQAATIALFGAWMAFKASCAFGNEKLVF